MLRTIANAVPFPRLIPVDRLDPRNPALPLISIGEWGISAEILEFSGGKGELRGRSDTIEIVTQESRIATVIVIE
jgi:hypothetical protein